MKALRRARLPKGLETQPGVEWIQILERCFERDDGVQFVDCGAAPLEQMPDALREKVLQMNRPLGHAAGGPRLSMALERTCDKPANRHAAGGQAEILAIGKNPDDPLRRSAEPKRIPRSTHPLPGPEEADDGVELVGERHRGPANRGGSQVRL